MIKLRASEGVPLPEVKEPGSVGLDVFTPLDLRLQPGDVVTVRTGVFVEDIPAGYWLESCEKSGLGARGIALRGRIIDTSYRGEIGIILNNTSRFEVFIERGKAIAQLIIRTAHPPADLFLINDAPPQVISTTPRASDGGLWRVTQNKD